MEEELIDYIKLIANITVDIIVEKMKKRKLKSALYLCNVESILYNEMKDKKVLFFKQSNENGLWKNFNDFFDNSTFRNEAFFEQKFIEDNLIFKCELINQTGNNLLLNIGEKLMPIQINNNLELYMIINQDLLENNNQINLRLTYFFPEKPKKKLETSTIINYKKNEFKSGELDFYKIV